MGNGTKCVLKISSGKINSVSFHVAGSTFTSIITSIQVKCRTSKLEAKKGKHFKMRSRTGKKNCLAPTRLLKLATGQNT